MVKTPKMRHSKSRREPVTIELEPGSVSRIVEEDAAKAMTKETKAEEAASASQPEVPEEPVHADQTDLEPWEHTDAAQARQEAAGTKSSGESELPYPAGSDAPPKQGFDYGFDDATGKTSEAGAGGTGDGSAEDAPKTTQTRNADMAAQPKRGGINGIAAGIIGGVIALAGAGGLQFAGLLGGPGS
ncbi:phage tail protein, partial [Mesorhizobium sanjuanii]